MLTIKQNNSEDCYRSFYKNHNLCFTHKKVNLDTFPTLNRLKFNCLHSANVFAFLRMRTDFSKSNRRRSDSLTYLTYEICIIDEKQM